MTAAKRQGVLVLIIILFSLSANAQHRNDTDTIIPAQTIEIIQNYKPEIAQPVKPLWKPTLNVIDTSKPSFNYDVPQQSLSYTYHSIPIQPLALGREEQKLPYANYIKLGYGNLNSLLLDGGVAFMMPNKYEGALHINHLSQKSTLQNQQSSLTDIVAKGRYFIGNHVLSASIGVDNKAYNFYGYNHDTFSFAKDDVKQSYLGVNITAGVANTTANDLGLWYQPTITINSYTDKYNGVERGASIAVPLQWSNDSSFSVQLGIKGNFVQFKNDSFSTSNNIFTLSPAVHFNLKSLQLHIGANPTWSRDWKLSVLPDIYVKLHTPDSRFALKAGWKGEIIQNTFEQLTRKNPYLYNIYPQQQTKFNQVYGGFESAFGSHLTLNATVSWRQWKGLPLFVNDYNRSVDGKYFTVINDSNVNAIGLNADATYQFAERFTIGVAAAWTNYLNLNNNDKAWMEPMLRFGGNFDWQIASAFKIGARMDFWDGMYARLPSGNSEKMKSFLDLSANAEYQIIPRISLFLQVNNLLGSHYQRWNQYPVYGFTIIGGLRVKF